MAKFSRFVRALVNWLPFNKYPPKTIITLYVLFRIFKLTIMLNIQNMIKVIENILIHI